MNHPAHEHEWNRSYDHRGTTYRECADPGCPRHQQWVCTLDRWSDTFETPSPREREEQRQGELKAASS